MFKITATTLTALAGLASANLQSISNQVGHLIENTSARAFSGKIVTSVEQLDEFGCWCYFYDNVGRGKGSPLDEVDAFCKSLADGYECAIRDSEDANEDCVPWDVAYNQGSGSGKALYTSCLQLNPTSKCSQMACAVEGNFVEQLVALFLAGDQINYDTYSHSQGFDPSTSAGCPVKPGKSNASTEKACCGAYPSRFPYKTLDGERGCCNSRTYSTNILNCCGNGQVKASCSA